MVQMSPSRKPMPSFTHVLTSGCHSVAPTTIHVDSYASPQMLPTPPDYWMVEDVIGEDADTQTIFEAEQTSNNSIKILLLFIRKFVPYKRNLVNNGLVVAPKPSLN